MHSVSAPCFGLINERKTMRHFLPLFLFSWSLSVSAQPSQRIPGDPTPPFSLSDVAKVQYQDATHRLYVLKDGRTIQETAWSPVNYKDASGQWAPISTEPMAHLTGFSAIFQPFPLHAGENGQLEIQLSKEARILLSCEKVGSLTSPNATPFKTGQKIYYPYHPNISRQVDFRINGFKTDYVLHQMPEPGDFEVIERLQGPAGTKLVPGKELQGSFELIDEQGTVLSRLYPPYAYDALGAILPMHYEISRVQNDWRIRYTVASSWLQDPSRVYPVTVDPLVTGPTALWSGGIMPSCELPSYHTDSLAVTIPGGVMITGMFCTGSYYASPITGTTMSNGSMYFSTSCGDGPVQTVAPPTGNSAGTAYLENVDFRQPLGCCLGASCSQRTVYVRFHLGRNFGPGGCNTSYIYYNAPTQWPFRVYVEGRTLETFNPQWATSPSSQCSDDCDVEMRAYVRFGVPPYTVNHPWMAAPEQMGTANIACSLPFTQKLFNLTRPDCPSVCAPAGPMDIPLPTITDACNSTVSGLPSLSINILPVPKVTQVTADSVFCAGETANITFASCVPGSDLLWYSGGQIGTQGSIDTIFSNASTQSQTASFFVSASANGCQGPVDTFHISVIPLPMAYFDLPEAALAFQPINLIDSSVYNGSSPGTVNWTLGDGNTASASPYVHNYAQVGAYEVCLTIENADGCTDVLCDTIQIIPQEVILPNVVTPNGDGKNDLLEIPYLPFYGKSKMTVMNRWGITVYSSGDYQNDWYPEHLSDGTYYYILELADGKVHQSTLNIFH